MTTARARRPSARERCWPPPTSCSTPRACRRVGIDRIIEHAGVAKASLYNTFGSKEELVRAYLETRHAASATGSPAAVDRYRDPASGCWRLRGPGRGLRPTRTTTAAPSSRRPPRPPPAALSRRPPTTTAAWLRALFTRLAAGGRAPPTPRRWPASSTCSTTAPAISARMDRDPTAALTARAAAAALIAAATGRAVPDGAPAAEFQD